MSITRWFQIFFMFYYSNLARDDEIWRAYLFKWVETPNKNYTTWNLSMMLSQVRNLLLKYFQVNQAVASWLEKVGAVQKGCRSLRYSICCFWHLQRQKGSFFHGSFEFWKGPMEAANGSMFWFPVFFCPLTSPTFQWLFQVMEMMIGGVSHGKRCGSIWDVSVYFVHVISRFVVFPGKWMGAPSNDILRFFNA